MARPTLRQSWVGGEEEKGEREEDVCVDGVTESVGNGFLDVVEAVCCEVFSGEANEILGIHLALVGHCAWTDVEVEKRRSGLDVEEVSHEGSNVCGCLERGCDVRGLVDFREGSRCLRGRYGSPPPILPRETWRTLSCSQARRRSQSIASAN